MNMMSAKAQKEMGWMVLHLSPPFTLKSGIIFKHLKIDYFLEIFDCDLIMLFACQNYCLISYICTKFIGDTIYIETWLCT